MSPSELWRFLPLGYLLSIMIETPILSSVCQRVTHCDAGLLPESG